MFFNDNIYLIFDVAVGISSPTSALTSDKRHTIFTILKNKCQLKHAKLCLQPLARNLVSCCRPFTLYIPPLKELCITSHSHSNSGGRSRGDCMVPRIHRERVQCLAQGHLNMWIQGCVQGPSANPEAAPHSTSCPHIRKVASLGGHNTRSRQSGRDDQGDADAFVGTQRAE